MLDYAMLVLIDFRYLCKTACHLRIYNVRTTLNPSNSLSKSSSNLGLLLHRQGSMSTNEEAEHA